MGHYVRPTTVDDALAALGQGGMTIVAGGTDFYPARVGRPLSEDILDITAVEGLRGIAEADGLFRFGAATTWTDVAKSDLPPAFNVLKRAAREVGGIQIQNAGTVAGNLCNASPAADGVPALLSLDASVELRSINSTDVVPLSQFILGNRRTALRPDQMLSAIVVPKPVPRARGHFLKLGARKYLVISIVMVAGVIEAADDGTVAVARVAVGACSPVAQRLPDLEAALVGRPCDNTLGGNVTSAHLSGLAPIDDIRASGRYRRDAALTLLRRTLNELGGEP